MVNQVKLALGITDNKIMQGNHNKIKCNVHNNTSYKSVYTLSEDSCHLIG